MSSSFAKTVVVGLSGGVDSAVSALLLKEQGYKVIGLFMKNWEDDDTDTYCSTRQDLIDVTSTADILDIDVEVVNFVQAYRDRVFASFLQEYNAGRTPNPDVLCNAEIKFAAFLDHAISLGAEAIATGHYAGVQDFDGQRQLLKAEDGSKDQSYFLYRLKQAQLKPAMFPLAQWLKSDVRAKAAAAGLPVAKKKDSTGICFIGERPFNAFLQRYVPQNPGEIRDLDSGKVLGQHQGLAFHTLGQRKGLHIGGVKGHDTQVGEHDAWYVAKKDMSANVLYVVAGHQHPALLVNEVTITDLNWISGVAPKPHWVYTAKTRYRMPDAACEIEQVDEQRAVVRFAAPQWAVTPGQSLVLYESRVCLGGGIIESACMGGHARGHAELCSLVG